MILYVVALRSDLRLPKGGAIRITKDPEDETSCWHDN